MISIKYFKKSVLTSLILIVSLCNSVFSQTIPAVPKRITMFDLNLVLDESTRKIIEKEMSFLASKKVYVDAKMQKMAQYFPIIEAIFQQENVPTSFKYLCAQESSFIADAVSSSNAVGFWQFKIGTATDYGLRVDDMVDERKNIVASTRAAALYLKKNNKTYQNWVSTLLSYRLGLTGAKNQVPADWTNASEITITDNIDWYVIRNIAHYIYFESELANFTPNGSYIYLHNNASGKSFTAIAQELQVDENELRAENVWCKTDIIPSDKNYTIVKLIKKDQKQPVLIEASVLNKPFFDIEIGYPILKIDEKKTKKTGNTFYTINGKDGILSIVGDTPQTLAERAGIKLQYFLSYNDLDKTDAIKPQMVYYLEKKNRKAKVPKHSAKKGQTIWLVSQMYGIRENRLLRMNRMKKTDALQAGRVLNLVDKRGKKEEVEFILKPFENEQLPTEKPQIIINSPSNTYPTKTVLPNSEIDLSNTKPTENQIITPLPETNTNTTTTAKLQVIVRDMGEKSPLPTNPTLSKNTETTTPIYTKNTNFLIVQKGENLFSLAKKYNITVTDLKKRNGLTTNTVETGQKLILPESTPNFTKNKQENQTAKKDLPVSTSSNYHVVAAGETLYRISIKYKTTIEKLKQLNNLPDNTIAVGQRLITSK